MAQSNKQVNWIWSAKKIADRTYEVHMTATIGGDFHLYAQDAGGDGPIATAFTFSKSPLLHPGRDRKGERQARKEIRGGLEARCTSITKRPWILSRSSN